MHRFRPRQPRSRTRAVAPSSSLIWIAILGAAVAVTQLPGKGGPLLSLPEIGPRPAPEVSFALCGALRRDNCVIDGDTFTYERQRIRIADIDAPETHSPRCTHEAELGERATRRLQTLLNDGPFALRAIDRDEDRYGRKLRIVIRDGRSLGSTLVAEGLARQWTGSRRPWCA
jgi:endonuclease YncB( thermonuclease family)